MATSSSRALELTASQVPAYKCPPGTKMHILDLGRLEVDEGWIIRGANTTVASNRDAPNKVRELIVLSCLIDYPGFGLILYETGCAEDLEVKWGAPLMDVFPRTKYTDDMKLPEAIAATGHNIKDVKAVVMGHLHLDHAGGLEHFMGTDVPIYVHEEEFKHACWAVATGADGGIYLANYMDLSKLKWVTFANQHYDFLQGISFHWCPGHSPGLVMMQVNLENDGTFIWTTDQFHVAENFEAGHPQGWLARDHSAWYRGLHFVQNMQKLHNAKLIFGHDKEVAEKYMMQKAVWE